VRLLAIGDLHLGARQNREALEAIQACPDDWLLIAGDIGETREHLTHCFEVLGPRFKQLVWVPGNHELWTLPNSDEPDKGEAKYRRLVDLCRRYGVLTPEDPYPVVTVGQGPVRIVPMMLLYDYSFRPANVGADEAVQWAEKQGVQCVDENLIQPEPYPDMTAWCRARVDHTRARLDADHDGTPTILLNHYPLRQELARLPFIPPFSIWCGTTWTEDWHERYNALAVVYGHLHISNHVSRGRTDFHEVSLGYPRQWSGRTINAAVRVIAG